MTPQDKILVVDDAPVVLDLLTDILSAEGFQVRSADAGELALHSVASEPFNLILLDIDMPGMDGFEVCRRLKAQKESREIPVIFISGMSGLEEKVKGFGLGAVDFISKPFQRDELLARVRTHLELHRLRAGLEEQVTIQTAELLKSEERFRVVAESTNDFIFEWNLKSGQMEWFGAAVEKLKDLLDEIPQTVTAYEKMVHPEDHDRLLSATRRHLDKQEPFLEEYRIIGKGGRTIYLKSSGTCLRSDKGRPYKWVGALSDITERKKKEEELKQSIEKLHKAMGGIIQAMALTVETRDPYTAGHQRRVADLARSIGQEMGLSKDQIEAIRMAGTVHDLGKISLPAEILSKPTKLSTLEFGLIKVHPQTSYDILKDIDFPWPIARIVSQHHERIDGSGYPSGLRGQEILLEAKVLMVADVVEAIASHRPYRAAYGIEIALDEISKNKGILYDPEVVEACLKLFKEKGFNLD